MGEKDGNMVTGNGRIFLLHGNAGSSIMFLYFSKKEKRLLAAGRSQCDYAVFGQFINLTYCATSNKLCENL